MAAEAIHSELQTCGLCGGVLSLVAQVHLPCFCTILYDVLEISLKKNVVDICSSINKGNQD